MNLDSKISKDDWSKRHCKKRLKRWTRVTLIILAIVLFIGWWNVLRIVEHDHWPPPEDAVTSAQSLEMTEAFVQRDDVRRDDVAIPYAPSTASDVELFLDGTQSYPAMIEDIESAESSIHILMFGFTPGGWGDTFADLLMERAADGVEVRMILDRQGSKALSANADFFQEMVDAGIQIVVNDTVPPQFVGELPDRDFNWRQDEVGAAEHRKMFVIDGRIGWAGGAGFEDHFHDGGWLDSYVRVEGDIVLQLQAVFCTSFHAYGGELPADLTGYFPAPEDAGDIRVTVLQNIPGGFLPGTQASREALEQSDEQLDVMNAYFTDAGMIDRIVDAAERGVDVRVIASADSNVMPAQYVFLSQYDRMLDAGVEILEVPGVMHAKVTVSDDTVIVGSINYDAWGLYRNLELALMIEDADVANAARAQLVEPVVDISSPGEPPDGWRENIPANFWWWLRYFL